MHRKHVLANPDLTSKSQTGFSKGHLNEKKGKMHYSLSYFAFILM